MSPLVDADLPSPPQEVLKLAADLKKRKTELLDKQLAQQKALLAKLENRALKPDERQKIVSTVKALQAAIDKTRAEALSAVEREMPAARAKEVVRDARGRFSGRDRS